MSSVLRRINGPAIFFWCAVAAHGTPASPLLGVAIDEAITIPGHNGKGALTRPLVLIFDDWKGTSPKIEALSLTGEVKATCTRLKSPEALWNTEVRYDVIEPGRPIFSGTVSLRLKLDGSRVSGHYEGAFNGIPMSGSPGAGLVFEQAFAQAGKGLLLWLPPGPQPVRGILIWGNGARLDNRYYALREDFQALAAANHLAVVATGNLDGWMEGGEGARIVEGLEKLGEQSGHPELAKAPIFFMGHSNGGFMASSFNAWSPGRLAGFVASHGFGFSRVAEDQAAEQLMAPGILTAGEVDSKVGPLGIESAFVWLRMQGAHLCLAVEQGENHAPSAGSMPLFLMMMQHVAERRLANGEGRLMPVDDRQAWLADNATWKDGITEIMPAASVAPLEGTRGERLRLYPVDGHVDFKALPRTARMSWLPDQDIAYIYRGLATYDNPLKIARADGHGPAYLAGEAVVLEATAFGGSDWKSVRVYDGATQVGEMTRAKPRLVLSARQKAGAHAGVLVGELANGALRTSLPISWVVWP